MSKEDKDFKSKDSKLGKTSADEIKSAGSGSNKFDKDQKFGKNKGNNSNKQGGKHKRFKTNDPSWYVANVNIVKDVANLPFAVYNGVTYDTFKQVINKLIVSSTSNFKQTVPGVAIYKYAPWYGTASPTSSLNLTMRALYSFVRHVNSGKTNYEAPDLMVYVMAMDSVYLLIHEVKRLLRLAYLYVLENRDIPEKVFSVLGIDNVDVVGNLANYRAQLNTRIAKANSLAVPANFNLFKRRAVMGSVVLTDEPNRPTQLIVPVADGFYKYTPTATTGSTLNFVIPGTTANADPGASKTTKGGDNTFIKTKTTINDYFKLLDDMLSVLLSDEDINIMSGDIIKAYGDNLYRIPFIEENEIQDVIHDENLLLQFTNSTVLDLPGATFGRFFASSDTKGIVDGAHAVRFENYLGFSAFPTITQSGGSLVARCTVDSSLSLLNQKKTVINSLPLMFMDNMFIDTTDANSISPENILEWTRLTMCFVENRLTANQYDLEAGVEIGLGWLVAQPVETFSFSSSLFVNKGLDKTLAVQWFQFGRRNSLDSKVSLPLPTDSPSIVKGSYYATYVCQEQINVNFSTTNKWARKYNTMYASKFMEGLSYGPRSYEVGSFEFTDANGVFMYGDMAIGKLGEKTAIANRFNITAMHDAALLGLISSPYVTTSK